jgi:hypothetical protein
MDAVEPDFMTVGMLAQTPVASAAPYTQTLTDLGDRLSWLNGLVEEIQEQASASGVAGTRLTEIAQMMGESMSEAMALQRRLQEQLETSKK